MTDRESFQQPVNIGAHEQKMLDRGAEEEVSAEHDALAEDKPKRPAKAKSRGGK